MSKNLFEIFIVISVMFIIGSFVYYKFFMEAHCNKYSNNDLTNLSHIIKTGSCKDSLVCTLTGVVIQNNYKLEDWKCESKTIDYYEYDFYKKMVLDIINKYKK